MESIWAVSRTRSSVNPYIEQDLRGAEPVPLKSWSDAVFDLPPGRFDEWPREIREQEWFNDETVQQSLFEYCTSTNETRRYRPFVALANRLVELAHGGLDEEFPISDFTFADNHDRLVDTIDAHEGLGAHHRPDILGLRRKHAKKLQKSNGTIRWVDILLVLELKFQVNLLDTFNGERVKRGLLSLDDLSPPQVTEVIEDNTSDPEKESEMTAKPAPQASTKRKKTPPTPVESAEQGPPQARRGHHRAADDIPEDEDLLAGIDRDPRLTAMKPQNDVTRNLDAGREVAIQAASYALEVLSCTFGTRSFCVSIILKDDMLSLWYYDASGVVYTKERLSLVTNFEKFAAIIVGFAQCTPEQFGVIPAVVLQPHEPYPRNFPPEGLGESSLWVTHPLTKQDICITLNQSLFTQYVMVGRRTFLYTVDTDRAISEKKLIIKFSYQVSTRQPEHSLVKIAREAKVRHLPDVHMWADLWKMSDGVRHAFLREDGSQAPFEDRILRAIVYTEYSSIRPLFTESCELIPVMVYQMINCLDDLWTKANMLHRDVSVNNIMYEKRGDDYHFVLIDFDMAVVLAKTESSYIASSRHRTGTLPFMAQELISDAYRATKKGRKWITLKHLLRHDLESLFWASLWCVLTLLTRCLSAREIDDLLGWARAWEVGGLSSIAGVKLDICMSGLTQYGIVLPPPAKGLKKWFKAWTTVLGGAYHTAKLRLQEDSDADSTDDEEPANDWETCGGKLTKENLQSVLLKAFPIPAQYCKTPVTVEPIPRARTITEKPVAKSATRARRPARKRVKANPPEVAPENDIRSRLRPRKLRT